MKRAVGLVSGFLCALGAGPAGAAVGTNDAVPAATLLLPYFQVDLDNPAGITTLLSINNASATAVLTRVTLWTDAGVRTVGFNVYLTGYDVHTINLRDVLAGTIVPTASHGQDTGDTQDPADGISNKGPLSQDINFASCNGVLPPPPLSAAVVAHLRAAHTGQPSAMFSNQCAGLSHGDNVARGYVLVDVVSQCSVLDPGDPGYFVAGGAGVATNQNVIYGDYFYIDPTNNLSQGDTLVSLEASATDPRTSASGAYTFYGSLVGGTAADNREPVGTSYAVRYLSGGVFDGGTDLVVWRDMKLAGNQQTFSCGTPPAALSQNQVLAFDEEENTEAVSGTTPFPAASTRAMVGGAALTVTKPFGWFALNLNSGSEPLFGPIRQGHVSVVMEALGRFGVGFRAVALDNASAPRNEVIGATDQAPFLASTTPAGGATNVSPGVTLTLTFSEAVSVSGNWFQIVCGTSGTRNVSDTAVSGGPTVFTIDPATDFATGEACTVTVFAAQVTDQDADDPPDNPASNLGFSFTTSTDQAPAVAATAPANGSTGHASNTNLTVTFSEDVTVSGNWFQLVCSASGTRNVADTAVSGGPLTFTIDPNADFTAGESCTLTVFAAQVADQDALDPPDTMAADHVSSFIVDAAPSVTATVPANGASGQPVDINLTVTFSEDVNVAGNWFQVVCATSGTRNVADTAVSGGPLTFTIDPNADFAPGETCTVTVFAAQVTDQDPGDPPDAMAADHVFSFGGEIGPSVTAVSPPDAAAGQAANVNLTVTFSEDVNVSGNWFQVVCGTSGTRNVSDTAVTGGPQTFTIDPNTDFTPGEACTFTIVAAQVADQDTSDPPDTLASNHVSSFTVDAAPSVSATVPTNGASGQAANIDLTLTFSEDVNVSGNWLQIVCGSSGTRNVADTVVTGGPQTFTVNPNVDFTAGETCTATVFAAQVTDQDAGDPPDTLAANHVFSFTVDAAPGVTATTPGNGAGGQVTTTDLTVTFSEDVNVTGNWFQMVCGGSGTRNVADTVVTGGPQTFTVNPNVDFAPGETCTVTVFAAQVADQDASDPPDNMAANHVFSFTTDAAPQVAATVPGNGDVDRVTNVDLTLTFSESVNVTGNWFQIVCGTSGTRNVADTLVTGGPTTFTVNPNVDFASGETCTVTVFAAQVTDQDGADPPDNMAANHVFSFSTEAAPSVSSTTPANGATGAALNTNLTLTFSENVNVTGNWFQIVCGASGTRNVSDTVVSGGPLTFTVNPNSDFTAGETCTVTVFAAQVTDQDATDPPDNMAANYVFSFDTDAAPAVTATTPANGGGSSSNGDLTVTFSESVNVAGNWFQVVCGTSGTRNVSDTVVTGGPLTFTVNPNADFTPGEACAVTVFAAQVTDQDGNDPPDAMAANHVFSFTVDAAPAVAGTTPPSGAVDQAVNTDLTFTFSENVNVTGNWFQIVCPTSGTRNVSDTVVSGGPLTFTVNPNTDFAAGEACTVTVFAAQVADQDATDPPDTMAANHMFSFSTDAVPAVSATTPSNGSTGDAVSTNLTVTFTENVNVTGNWFQIACGTSGTRNVADTVVTGGPLTFTINPNADFAGGETCTATVFAAQVTDQDTGDPPDNMVANYVFSFTTDLAPSVSATTPVNGATGVATNTDLTFTFSENVNVAGNWFQIACATSGTRNVADTVVTGGPLTFTINPNVDFAGAETCTTTVFAAQVTDQDASDPPDNMTASYVFSFTTDAAPSVGSTTPANGATDVAASTNLTVTFSENVNVAGNWFQIVCGSSGTRNVADTVVTGGPLTFTIDPNANFTTAEVCTVTVFAAQVTDQDGNDPPDNMTANQVFSFTVFNAPPNAVADGFQTIGNTFLEVASSATAPEPRVFVSGSVLSNDTDDGPLPLTVTGTSNVPAGAVLNMNPNGTFTYVPSAGATGSQTFDYTVTDGVLAGTGTVTITLVSEVWYVKNDAAAGGLGRSTDPFDTLAEAVTFSGNDDTVYVFFGDGTTNNQAAGFAMKTNQRLIGEGVALTVPVSVNGGPNPTTLRAAGTRPLIDNTTAGQDGVAASNDGNVEIRGLNIAGANNAIDLTTTGANGGTVTIADNVLRGAGAEGVDVNAGGTGTLTLAISNNTLTATGTALDIQRTAGTVVVTAFLSNVVSGNTGGSGIVVTGPVTFDAVSGGNLDQVALGTTIVGASGNGVGGSGLVLNSVTGDLAFTDLDVFADNGTGLSVTGAAAFSGGAGTRVTVGAGVAIIEATNGPAVSLNNLTADLQLTSVRSTSSSSGGVSLVSVSDGGTTNAVFSAGSGSSITNTSGSNAAFIVSGGNAKINYAGTITNNSTSARAVFITLWIGDDAGDDILLSGAIDENGAGIEVSGNGGVGRSITFSGGMDIDTTTGAGFAATSNTNTGGLHVTGTNTIDSASATALRVTNTTIGVSNLTFQAISSGNNTAAADPANGIVLSNTGALGGLTVTGTGAAGSGGTIQNTTGMGISLASTRAAFQWLNVTNTGNHGVDVSGVTNFNYQDGTILNAGDGNDEHSMNLLNVFGSSLIEDVVLDDINEDGIQVRQNATDDGTVDTLTIRRLNVQDHVAPFGEAGVEIQADLASNLSVLVDDSDFAINANAILGVAASTAATHTGILTVTAQNNTFNCAAAFGSGSFQALGGGSGTANYIVTGNSVNGTKFDGIRVNNDDAGTTNATITNNIVTGSGATNNGEGITLRQDMNGTLFALITGNTISQIKSNGIHLQAGDDTTNDPGVELSAAVMNNTATVRGDGFGAGLLVDVGDGSGVAKNDACINVSGNTLAGTDTSPFFDFDITLQLNETADASLRVTQTSSANLSAVNNGASVSFFENAPNTITFNGGVCATP